GNQNFGAMYEPYNSTYRFSESDWKIGYSGSVADADKKSGFYGGIMIKSSEARTALVTTQNTADYYLDLSSSKNYGIEHTPGTPGTPSADDYSLKLLFGNVQFYSSQKDQSNNPNSDDTECKLISSSSSKGSTMNANSDEMPTTLTTGSKDGLAFKSEVTISGDAVDGDVIEGTYKVTYADKNSHTSIASSETKIKVNVIDKSSARIYYNDIIKSLKEEEFSEKCYTATSWRYFHDLLLTTEFYLNDNTNLDDPSILTDAMEAAYNGLVVDENAEHSFLTYTAKDAATCDKNATESSMCSFHCGTEKVREIPETSLGHSLSSTVVPPTCETDGYTRHYCTRSGCDYYYDDTPVSRSGHNYNIFTSNGDKTHTVKCANNASHTYVENCSFEYTVKEAPTPIKEGTGEYRCPKCDYYYTVKIDVSSCSHENTNVVGKVDATCEEGGYTGDTQCTDCEKILATGVALSPLGHSFSYVTNDDAVPATCSAEGRTASKTGTCTRDNCDKTDFIEGAVLSRLPHQYGAKTVKAGAVDATCTTMGKTVTYSEICNECGYERVTGGEDVSINPIAHPDASRRRINTTITESTCITNGTYSSDLTCIDCGTVIEHKIETSPLKPHSFTNYVFDDDTITCENTTATETAICDTDGCDATDTRIIPFDRLPHNWGEYSYDNNHEEARECSVCHSKDYRACDYEATVTNPSCTEQGYTTYTCKNCGHSYVDNYVNANGHNFGADSNAPVCSVCNAANPNYVPPQPQTPQTPQNPVTPPQNTETPAQQPPQNSSDNANNSASDTVSSTGVSSSEVEQLFGVDAATAQQIIYVINQYNISSDTLRITEEAVTSRTDDSDIKGSKFYLLRAQTNKIDKKSIKITWNSVSGADGYIVYAAKCGKKNKLKKVATVSSKTKSYTFKKLKKGTYYKAIVVAYKNVGGKKVTLAGSKTIHATTTGGKYGVAKDVKINKIGKKKNAKSVSLKLRKSAKIVASEVKKDKTIKKHRAICFESDNPNVAVVDSNGKITAKGKGKCKIYVYAQNGKYKTVSVTVK
ncbi:MAG: fibronectin type III domain-containing protein, partial [Eubacterium sp.]